MNTLNNYIAKYIEYCEYRKRLDSKTLKAYKIDLRQFEDFCADISDCFAKGVIDDFIREVKLLPKIIPFHSIQTFLLCSLFAFSVLLLCFLHAYRDSPIPHIYQKQSSMSAFVA